MNREKTIKLAKKIPEYVVNAFLKLKEKYPVQMLICIASKDDPITLGQLMYDLYEIDEKVVSFLSTADGQLIDSEKLELAIIALDLHLKHKTQ